MKGYKKRFPGATDAYVNPMTFVTLKINARMVVGTESRFSLTIAMIRSPTQRTGKAYKAICFERRLEYGSMGHPGKEFCETRPKHSRRCCFSKCVEYGGGSLHAYLESTGFAGRDGCVVGHFKTC